MAMVGFTIIQKKNNRIKKKESDQQPMSVGLNSQFDPKVYVGKIYSPAQSAPLSFSVVTEQYVVDSTLELKNNAYGGDAAETITIAFCEVQKPDLVNGVAPVECARNSLTWCVIISVQSMPFVISVRNETISVMYSSIESSLYSTLQSSVVSSVGLLPNTRS